MKRGWFGAAIALIVIGLAILTGAFIAGGFDIRKLGGEEYETREIDIPESFTDIKIGVSISDIEFARSEDGTCKIVSKENKHYKHSAEVKDGVLKITSVETRKWYEFTLFSFGSPKVTVYLPDEAYRELKINVSTGDIKIPSGFRFGTINLTGSTGSVDLAAGETGGISISTSTGNIRLADTAPGNLIVKTSTGKVTLNHVTARELRINTSTGDVKLDGCDADEIRIETSTGDVSGNLLSPKHFTTKTSTGSVKVPNSEGTGTCTVKTSTGDIKITVR